MHVCAYGCVCVCMYLFAVCIHSVHVCMHGHILATWHRVTQVPIGFRNVLMAGMTDLNPGASDTARWAAGPRPVTLAGRRALSPVRARIG